MTIVEFFDIHNTDHLVAWRHLSNTGNWPENFLPENIKFPILWQIEIRDKMVEAWIKDKFMDYN